ncbi:MAG: CHAD domain-containing protein, partial [Variibacter sp.]|nr:CHAD domain-containing protein [Variibacter sp.]
MRAGEPVGEALRAFARDILAEADAVVRNPDAPDAIVVHDFRKAMKRWRAFLRLIGPLTGEEPEHLRLAARDLARSLAAARDSQSALDALADLAHATEQLSARTRASIRGRLERLRDQAETVALSAEARAALGAYLEEAHQAVANWPLDHLDFSSVAEALSQDYARARNAIPDDWENADDEALHRLRQRIVVHRYQMPLVEALWPRLNRLIVGEAQRMRERLGAHQDLAVLATMTALRGVLAPWRARLAAPIADRKQVHAQAAARLARR